MLIHIKNNTYHYESTYAENNMFSNRGNFLVWVEVLRPSQQYSVMSGQSQRFLGITVLFGR